MAQLINCKINNRVINTQGKHVTITNGKIFIDGKPIEDYSQSEEKVVNIVIEGSVDMLQVDCCTTITVNGDTKNVKTGSGDVAVTGNVKGNVHTGSGDVRCGTVEEDVSTGSGDIHCGSVYGRVTSMSGDIYKQS